ncbi:MAG: hypothetical protein J4G19_08975 [Pseudomonadales bacterium]|nr:hypothetical protein [Pseudomonadales bacterium]
MRIRVGLAGIFLTLSVSMASQLQAEPGGIYYGASATLQQAEVLYRKSVLGRFEDSTNESSEWSSSGEVEDKPLQWDGMLGYRLNFADGTQFLALQAEIALTGDDISGRLDGAGNSPGRNVLGEAWPEDWTLETSRSMGVVAKYGVARSLFGTIDISLYGLAGVRQTTIDFFSSFHGCFELAGCSVDDLRTATQSYDPQVNLLVAGFGLETGISGKTSLQFELRLVEDFEADWIADFEGEGWEVDAPGGFTVENTDLAVKLIRYL